MSSSAPIRIAYLVSQYPAVNHTFILREIRQLRAMGLDVQVASVRAADRSFESLSPEEKEEQRKTFYIKPGGFGAAFLAHLMILFSRPLFYLRGLGYALQLAGFNARPVLSNLLYFAEAVVLANWMQSNRLSHVHMHFTSTVGLMARRVLPMRTSATIHGSAEFDNPDSFYLREKIEAFDLLCAISQYGRSQLMRLCEPGHWSKIRVARLGVDPEVYAPAASRESPSLFEILSVGSLTLAKGHHLLIGAVQRLLNQGRPVRLRLVGDGPARGVLEAEVARRRLEQHVTFEGWQNADRVRACYRQADIFALASFAEGIPVVLMEAMATEVPCVATWIAGIPELIRHEVDGLLVPPSSEEELAAALGRLLDDTGLRLHLGRSARQRVVEQFDLGRNAELFAAILREVAS